jgi:anti-sigma regulatory factor (Ser/Thr protein kinase)
MERPSGGNGHTSSDSRPLSGHVGARHELVVTLLALPESSALFRERIKVWLEWLRWPADERADVIAAAAEAVENAIDHAYPLGETGDIELDGRVEATSAGARQVVLTVTDHGRWRRRVERTDNRGRGFTIMYGSMAGVRVLAGKDGTRVELRSRPVPR